MHARNFFVVAPLAATMLMVSCETPSATTPPGSQATPSSPAAPAVPKIAPATVAPTTAPQASKPAPIPQPAPQPTPSPGAPAGQVSQIDISTLFGLQGEGRAFILDVRPAFFYNLGHIPGAINMPLKSFDTAFPAKRADLDAAVSAGKVIVLYCVDEDCPDGRTTARRLAKEGYSTSVYTAGWKEWRDSGL